LKGNRGRESGKKGERHERWGQKHRAFTGEEKENGQTYVQEEKESKRGGQGGGKEGAYQTRIYNRVGQRGIKRKFCVLRAPQKPQEGEKAVIV